jgi:anti-sigma factor RsiW
VSGQPGHSCAEFVELVTHYLDNTLPEDVAAAVDEHLSGCGGCRAALAQWRTVIDLTGHLTEADVARADPLATDRLMTTFRRLRRR